MFDHAYFFSFILFTRFHICFYFYYLLINKFSGHKRINVIFCMHLIKEKKYYIRLQKYYPKINTFYLYKT
jgi:hypothetical protein